jgi:hypothetical protein
MNPKAVALDQQKDMEASGLCRSGFKTSPQAQYLRWSVEFNPQNPDRIGIPPVELIAPP